MPENHDDCRVPWWAPLSPIIMLGVILGLAGLSSLVA